MSDYLLQHGTRETAQSEPMDPQQVPNSAGGFTWKVDDWTRLHRFLILGSEGGSYYSSERDLTSENVGCVRKCALADGPRLVEEIVAISDGGRAPKNDPALYALAVAISLGDDMTKRMAAEALPRVARIGTHLYHFAAFAKTMRGWGPTLQWAVSNWYVGRTADELAYDAVKYRQRGGWSHRDLLRLAHPSKVSPEIAAVFDWIVRPDAEGDRDLPAIIDAFETAQATFSSTSTAALIRSTTDALPREALQSDHLADPDVWRALLERGMPLTAMVRNLATMTRNGAFDSRESVEIALSALGSREEIKRARVHPMTLLVALSTYACGYSLRGSSTWRPNPSIIDALDAAFYLAFDNVEPTGKRHLLALDVSGSMAGGGVAGSLLTPREASVAMALVTLHVEADVEVIAFSGGTRPLPLSRRQRLDDAVRSVSGLPFDRTDCAQPMLYAAEHGLAIDMFAVYTDSETWAGSIHPKQALDRYREKTGIPARSAVVGMVSNGFTIADPRDAGMLDCVGFDTSTPGILAAFASGNL